MAAESRVGERVYRELRKRLLAGEFRLRDRLDVAGLSAKLGASNTPVREALVRLAAERLIAARPPRGFFVALWSEAELKALYEWRMMLTRTVIEQGLASSTTLNEELDFPTRTAGFFQSIEARANPELGRAGANADDRLFFARAAEAEIFENTDAELADLAAVIGRKAKKPSLEALARYLAQRMAALRVLRERAALKALGPNGE